MSIPTSSNILFLKCAGETFAEVPYSLYFRQSVALFNAKAANNIDTYHIKTKRQDQSMILSIERYVSSVVNNQQQLQSTIEVSGVELVNAIEQSAESFKLITCAKIPSVQSSTFKIMYADGRLPLDSFNRFTFRMIISLHSGLDQKSEYSPVFKLGFTDAKGTDVDPIVLDSGRCLQAIKAERSLILDMFSDPVAFGLSNEVCDLLSASIQELSPQLRSTLDEKVLSHSVRLPPEASPSPQAKKKPRL